MSRRHQIRSDHWIEMERYSKKILCPRLFAKRYRVLPSFTTGNAISERNFPHPIRGGRWRPSRWKDTRNKKILCPSVTEFYRVLWAFENGPIPFGKEIGRQTLETAP